MVVFVLKFKKGCDTVEKTTLFKTSTFLIDATVCFNFLRSMKPNKRPVTFVVKSHKHNKNKTNDLLAISQPDYQFHDEALEVIEVRPPGKNSPKDHARVNQKIIWIGLKNWNLDVS